MNTIDVGAFELLEPLGAGGMGEVWRGRHREQGVEVAVKVITGELATKQTYVEGFAREVQAVAGLNHPGICRVFDYGRHARGRRPPPRGGSCTRAAPGWPWSWPGVGAWRRRP